MAERYDHREIEKKWQERWEEEKAFAAPDNPQKDKKLYVLDMFPYPSGAGLHVGHVEGYTATDIYSRYKRMKGIDVLHPMGWDAFGLPAENYAIKTGIHPAKTTNDAIETFRRQIKSLGLSYDWSREIGAHMPDYYKWTQWFFLFLYKNGLAYKKKALVNWDPVDQTVLANEQVLPDGTAERSGAKVEKKELEQWFFKITDFADALNDDLDNVDWPESTKIAQRNWIGRSEGTEIDFKLTSGDTLTVFTTRADTLFGATYMVVAPEHPIVKKFADAEVMIYVEKSKAKSELERTENKEKTGVELKGVKAINPATKEEIPVFIADYVLGGYGTGAIMAVPAHDERDYEFSQAMGAFDEAVEPVIVREVGEDAFKKDAAISERRAAVVVIKHWSEEKYLGVKWSTGGWQGFVIGGIEEGEDAAQAAIREAREETGYQNFKFVRRLGVIHSKFFQTVKKQNRLAHFEPIVLELENSQHIETSAEEQALHSFVWLTPQEMNAYISHEDMKIVWQRAQTPISIRQIIAPKFEDSAHVNGKELSQRICTSVILKNAEGKYLLLKWSNGIYGFIGGGVEEGESPLVAAEREVVEETGLHNFKIIHKIFPVFYGSGYKARKDVNCYDLEHFFFAELVDHSQQDLHADDVGAHELHWLSPQELEKVPLLGHHREVWRYVNQHTGCYRGEGTVIHSEQFDGLLSKEARVKISEFVGGTMVKQYHLRDWLISRQRYWGAPIPVVYDPSGNSHPIPEEHLPWLLPTDVEFKPTGTSPLGQSKELKERTEKIFGEGWRPEADTMDTFVCSSWYYYRFADPHNQTEFASKSALEKWLPVDLYVGGAEHTVLHLLYARFFTKVLEKYGYINFSEPFIKLRHQGIILAEDGSKMSKSKGNVINPDDVVEQYGADALRLYEMFLGPLETQKPWNTKNILGVKRFLDRVWRMSDIVIPADNPHLDTVLNSTINKVGSDIENLKFNTAISQMMIFVNAVEDEGNIGNSQWGSFLCILAPFAPHIANELAQKHGVNLAQWPQYDPKKLAAGKVTVALQINGKTRATVELSPDISREEAVSLARTAAGKWLTSTEKKVVYVPGRIINFVI